MQFVPAVDAAVTSREGRERHRLLQTSKHRSVVLAKPVRAR